MSRAVAQPLQLQNFQGALRRLICNDSKWYAAKKTSPHNKWSGWHRLRRLILQRYLEGPIFWLINVGTKRKKRAVTRVWKPEINTEIPYNMPSKTFPHFPIRDSFVCVWSQASCTWTTVLEKAAFEVSYKWLYTLLRCTSNVTILKVEWTRFRGRNETWHSETESCFRYLRINL